MKTICGVNSEITGTEYEKDLAAVCVNGTFVGRETDGVRSYKGIPYAKAPVGELRWKPPVSAEADDRCYEAYYFGKTSIQTEAETERASMYLQGEDCLTLNIWTSDRTSTEGKPVMVFFPGGAFGWGGTADPLYDGQNFVKAHDDIVLVTVNYRVGLMGFMDFSQVKGGEDYSESGNLGLLDQICALQWVQENIRQFGGDAGNVTIFGESAGGSSVSLLPLIKGTKGLFHRVIAQSGAVNFTFSREEGQYLTEKLLKKTKASSMEDLLALSEAELMKINEDLNDYNNFPERDGLILPEDPYSMYEAGAASDVDMMIGTNADEARYWIGEVGGYRIFRVGGHLIYASMVSRIDPEDRKYVNSFMDLQEGEEIWNKTEWFNDVLFRVPAIAQAAAHAEAGGNTYMYYWTKESAIPHYGACHAVELAYVFGNLDDTIFTGEKADAALAETVQEMWVSFAKTGDPGTKDHKWEKYDAQTRNTMILGDDIHAESDPMEEQRVLTEPLLHYWFNGYYRTFDFVLDVLKRQLSTALLILAAANAAACFIWRMWKRRKKD